MAKRTRREQSPSDPKRSDDAPGQTESPKPGRTRRRTRDVHVTLEDPHEHLRDRRSPHAHSEEFDPTV